jgi:phosphoglycolate phosphatase
MNDCRRLAVFDIDGTLVDSQHNIVAGMTAACQVLGVQPPPAEAVRRIIGLSLADAMARLFPDGDERLYQAIVQGFRQAFSDNKMRPDHREPMFPGAAAALRRLDAGGWLLGIATGKSRRGVDMMIERFGLEGLFVTLQTPDANPGKPHPGMVLSALAETGVPPARAVMIGDTVYDMAMGMRAGVRTAGVAWGYHPPEELLAAGADIMLGHYGELPAALDALLGRTTCAQVPS